MSDPETLYQAALAAHAAGRLAEAAPGLAKAADAGHPGALTLLGGCLLVGDGLAAHPAAGVEFILRAARAGDGRACELAAVVLAAGAGAAPRWDRALDFLQRSAELGHPPAQGQLRLLAGQGGLELSDAEDWARLRAAVDLAAWRAVPAVASLSDDPAVQALPGFAPQPVCDWIIARARAFVRPAEIYGGPAGPARDRARSNGAAPLDLLKADLIHFTLRERIAAATGRRVETMEPPQVLHYAVGQAFAPHFDFLDPASPAQAADLARRGQRVATALVYLNADYEGGATTFPRLGIAHRGAAGDALTFANVDAAGRPDPRSLHAGEPPASGEKWVLSQWIRDRPQAG